MGSFGNLGSDGIPMDAAAIIATIAEAAATKLDQRRPPT